MRVGVDFDGPGHIFWHGIQRFCDKKGIKYDNSMFPGNLPCCWDFYTHFGWSKKQFKEIVDEGVDANYVFRGHTIKGFRESLAAMKAAGHEIHIITDRFFGSNPENSHKATHMNLAENMIEFDTVTFSPDKTCVPTDVFVEDKIENYDALAAAGVKVYLINYPWNQRNDSRNRIKDIAHFAKIVNSH